MKRFILIVLSLAIATAIGAVAYPMVSPYHARLRTEIADPTKRQAAIHDAIEFEKTHYKAVTGNMEAQYKFALSLTSGELGFKDSTQAVTWFQKSANQGYPLSEFAMAHHCFTGDGIRQDEADGATWTEKAMQTGQVSAAREVMGLLLAGAIGEKQDVYGGLGLLKQGQTSDSLQLAANIDEKYKAVYALPKEQQDAALADLNKTVQTDVRERFPSIEKNLAKITLVKPAATETAAK